MNGRERIALAMAHKLPDQVPVMCQLASGHYFLNTDIPPHKIWFSSEGFAEKKSLPMPQSGFALASQVGDIF